MICFFFVETFQLGIAYKRSHWHQKKMRFLSYSCKIKRNKIQGITVCVLNYKSDNNFLVIRYTGLLAFINIKSPIVCIFSINCLVLVKPFSNLVKLLVTSSSIQSPSCSSRLCSTKYPKQMLEHILLLEQVFEF